MYSWLNDATVRRIDSATLQHGRVHASLGELEQLAVLFRPPYLRDLYKALAPPDASERLRRSLTIKLAWIDKIPLAATDLFKQRVELGDVALFAIDQWVGPDGRPYRRPTARAVIAQAKVVRTLGRLRQPLVPGARVAGSTKRELCLLSRWPKFSLYKTSASDVPVIDDIDLRGNASGPLPYGWYVAAPCGPKPNLGDPPAAWPSWWMAGPPILSDPLSISFGKFLCAFLGGSSLPTSAGPLSAGQVFNCPSYPPIPKGRGWDRLCAEILKLVEDTPFPQHIFGQSKKRIVELEPILRGFVTGGRALTHFLPLWSWPDFATGRRAVFDRVGESWYRSRHFGDPEPGRGMPVLIFHTTMMEG